MITAVIGHRGSGKSQFLVRAAAVLAAAGREVTIVDLDAEIEKAAGRPISELFPDIGEEAFRTLERKTADEMLSTLQAAGREALVGLGAGFDGDLPDDIGVLWMQRATDSHGRIFLDRPPLEPGLGPLEEYHNRFPDREARYQRLASETLLVPEGVAGPTRGDELILGIENGDTGGFLTILPGDIESNSWDGFLAKRLAWGINRFEIRDDLIPQNMANRAADIPPQHRLVSYRSGDSWLDTLTEDGVAVDWALELGFAPPTATIVSRHERQGSLAATAADLVAAGGEAHLKLAVEVADFAELWQGHRWWSEDPANRSFLPRSVDGRWAWYRQRQRGHMAVNFLREGAGSAPDQPTLTEWLATPPAAPTFAAILGDPVDHSRTPGHHAAYFGERGMAVVRIRMSAEECTADNMNELSFLGLTYAAVTAPLKETVHDLCGQVIEPASTLRSVNTLLRSEGRWVGTNTDLAGVAAITHHISDETSIALWGGGGTRNTMLTALPTAVPYSARSGEPVDGESIDAPDIVIWAVGRDRQPACQWPPEDWRPQEVIDLNYSEDSPGLEYAWRNGIAYRSGIEMFEAQAAQQQEFWDGR